MIELPDDQLDKLFKKSLEEPEIIYEPADWNDLKKRLDQQDGKTPFAWLRKWWPLGILIPIVLAFIVNNWQKNDELAIKKGIAVSKKVEDNSPIQKHLVPSITKSDMADNYEKPDKIQRIHRPKGIINKTSDLKIDSKIDISQRAKTWTCYL